MIRGEFSESVKVISNSNGFIKKAATIFSNEKSIFLRSNYWRVKTQPPNGLKDSPWTRVKSVDLSKSFQVL